MVQPMHGTVASLSLRRLPFGVDIENSYYNNWCFPMQTRDAFAKQHGDEEFWHSAQPENFSVLQV